MCKTDTWHLFGFAETNLSTKTSSVGLVNRTLFQVDKTAYADHSGRCSIWPGLVLFCPPCFHSKICLFQSPGTILDNTAANLATNYTSMSPAWPSEDIQCPFPWVKAQRDALMFDIHTQVYVPGSPLRPRLPRFPGGPAETKTNMMNCRW